MNYGNIYENYEPGIVPVNPIEGACYWFAFKGSKLLVEPDDAGFHIPFITHSSGAAYFSDKKLYLGLFKGEPCYCCEAQYTENESSPLKLIELRALFGQMDEATFLLANRALQLLNWDLTSRFCGKCGSANCDKEDERAKLCPKCGHIFYPRISPAPITAVTRDNQILLAHSTRFPGNMHSLIAGFSEVGETLEDCVKRELMEEVGIRVKNIRYFGSQPWPYPDSLMIGFIADYDSGEIRVDGIEISHAEWFPYDKLPELPSRLSIARKIIDWLIENPA
ncbi:MAG: NAD(+) diphosphatase [Clostridia bacterium]|nr:NAD(+) diphosphatase [Clostridia bacterium]